MGDRITVQFVFGSFASPSIAFDFHICLALGLTSEYLSAFPKGPVLAKVEHVKSYISVLWHPERFFNLPWTLQGKCICLS